MSWQIEPLMAAHDRRAFACGYSWLDAYLRQHALRNQEAGYGRTFVAVSSASNLVRGYFTLSMSAVSFEKLPDSLSARMPKYPMPVAHIGCLAVASDMQGVGLGRLLITEAFKKILAATEVVAAQAIEVRAIDEKAADWYARYGFTPFRDTPLHLFLPMATARMIVAEAT